MEPNAHCQPEPLQVVLDFVSAADNGTVHLVLAENVILRLFECQCRGIRTAATFLRDVRHVGFKEAAEVRPGAELILEERFKRFWDGRRRRLYEQMERQRATTMHLRLETDDEVLPGRLPQQVVTPPRPASFDMDQLKYVEANGELVSRNDYECGKVHLTLGYRQAPLGQSQERRIEIYLAVYEWYHERFMPLHRGGCCKGTEGTLQNRLDDQVSGDPPADGNQEQLSELQTSQGSPEERQEDSMID